MLEYIMQRLILISVCLVASLWPMSLTPPLEISSNNEVSYIPVKNIDLSKTPLVDPKQLAADDKYIYIIDDFNKCIYKFDHEGDLITKVDHINGDRFTPGGIAIDFDYVYMTDQDQDIIFKFSKSLDLQLVHSITINSTDSPAAGPGSIFIDQNKDIYVVDTDMNSIMKLNFLGHPEWRYGRFGSSSQTLSEPIDLSVDDHGNIYIADSGDQTIKVFDQEWTFLKRINSFSDIHGITNEQGSDRLYAADPGSKKILIYSNKDIPYKIITNWKELAITPMDVYIYENKLYVLDLTKHILVYEIK